MATRFNADGVTGVVAIYDGTADDAPMTDPLSNKARIRFHSGLTYRARIATLTGSISLPARPRPASAPYPGYGSQGYQSIAHGQTAGIPMIEGKWIGIGTGGADVPAVGSVPVQTLRWLTMGADATHIRIHEMWGTQFDPATSDAITINFEVHILNRFFTP